MEGENYSKFCVLGTEGAQSTTKTVFQPLDLEESVSMRPQ